jgi:transcriptional regulator with XRE-family HTH domain
LKFFSTGSEMNQKTAQRADFADRLRTAIERKGWSISETARRAADFLDEGEKFGRAHVWHYLQGKAIPRARYLEALSRALEVQPADLIPVASSSSAAEPEAVQRLQPAASGIDKKSSLREENMVHVRDYGDGTALLDVSQGVSWDTALEILRILKAEPR